MGTIQHHQSRSDALLRHACDATEAAIAAPATFGPTPPGAVDPFIDGLADAVDSIRRAAAHAATALAVHGGFRHNTTRRLQIALANAIFGGQLRRAHLRTFRQTYSLAAILNLPTPAYKIASLARAAAGAGHTASAGNAGHAVRRRAQRRHPGVAIGHRPMATTIQTIRRMCRRVASLKNAIAAIIAGHPKLVRRAQRSLRCDRDEFTPTTPTYGEIRSAGEIARLPYYQSFLKKIRTGRAYRCPPTAPSTPATATPPAASAVAARSCATWPATTTTTSSSSPNGAKPSPTPTPTSKSLSSSPSNTPASSAAQPETLPGSPAAFRFRWCG